MTVVPSFIWVTYIDKYGWGFGYGWLLSHPCPVDAGLGPVSQPRPVDSRLRGNDGPGRRGYSAWRGSPPRLWIDEYPMNRCEVLGFQPKGVDTL